LIGLCESVAAAGAQRGSVIGPAIASQWRCCAQCLTGELREAAQAGGPAIEIARAGWTGTIAWSAFYVARSQMELGEPEQAESTIAAALDVTDHPNGRALLYEARGRLALAGDRHEHALAAFLDSAAQVDPVYSLPAVFGWRPLAAIAASALGDGDRAQAWIAQELEAVTGRHVPRVRAVVLRAGGIVRGGEQGIEMLTESVRLLTGSPAALELAHSHVELGAALRRLGRRLQAREQLRAGLQLAVSFGAAPLAQRARDELAASGARLRRDQSSGRDALTPSELRMAGLAAQGLSVPEIARRLVLSPKTVEWHLGRVYRKLGVHSRAELQALWRASD
ncbi:MAG: helix-turn-helix transcriptional regulator, partial [Solirubrobacteraceae bacterium]